jgi:hypothetical protein
LPEIPTETVLKPLKPFGILAAATLLAGACDSRQPITATPTASTVPVLFMPSSLQPLVSYDIAGMVVDNNDVAVPGASVRFAVVNNFTTVTDATGAFKATVELRAPSVEIRVEKPGYEPSLFDASANPGNFQDFRNLVRLYPITRITVGEPVQLPLLDGAFCGSSEFEYVCRRIRMVLPAAGFLTLDVAPDDYHLVPAGPIQYPDPSTSRLSIRAVAGGEIPVDVLLYGNLLGTSPKFTVHSSLAPN